MATAQIAKGLTIYANGINAACVFKSFTKNQSSEVLEKTVLCDTSKTYTPGLKDATVNFSGLWDFDESDPKTMEEVVKNSLNDGSNIIATASKGVFTVGGKCSLIEGVITSSNVNAEIGQLIMTDLELQATNGILQGVWLVGSTFNQGTTNGTSVDNLVSSANGGTAHVHVILGTATTVSVKIQHSSNGITFVDLLDFGDLERSYQSVSLTASGTINRYLRAVITADDTTGAVFIAFGRR